MGWFKEYKPEDPLRLVCNVEEKNRVHRILNDIKGIGCRIEKPMGGNGLGWRIIVGNGTDEDPIPDSRVGTDTGQIPFKPYDLQAAIGLPRGVILFWYGSVATIPPGFALCDGNNGTPDLRHRFIRGAAGDTGADYAGQTGGADSHGHSGTASIAKTALQHGHAHTHEVPLTFVGHDTSAGANIYVGNDSSVTTGSAGAAADTIAWPDTSTSVSASISIGNTSAIPSYYALAYIMKL